jgi:hypothetical protein
VHVGDEGERRDAGEHRHAAAPISASVVAALRLLGLRNAGTPLAMASTPVSAVHPAAKARSTKNTRRGPRGRCAPRALDPALSACGASPENVWNSP